MVHIAVIANKIDYAEYIKRNLEVFFKPFATFRTYSVKEIQEMNKISENVVVISAYTIFKAVQGKLNKNAILQIFTQTLSKDNIDKLRNATLGSRALLVDIDYRTCMQVIAQLFQAGFQGIDFIPYYGDMSTWDRSITTAVTPGESWLVPDGIKEVIDIGDRIIDMNCIIELADKIGAGGIFDTPQAQAAKRNIISAPWGIDRIFSEKENINEKIRALIEYIQDGVIITDPMGRIYLSNQKARSILKKGEVFDGFEIQEMLPGIDLTKNHEKGKEMLLNIDNRNIITSNRVIFSKGQRNGNIITIKNYDELEYSQHQIRNKISGEKHIARFTFADIKGSSVSTQKCIEKAKRFARSDASVLITGPSGVGKEVFAQSIHNESNRKRYNFVALNCAAIPENLLESELFGYEDGAFTGAKKGGKIGYFELAHKGTIFLDEIGEMPLALQSKLLRVIEERRFSKIGSSKVIDIDVRIIAATNQNLEQLASEKAFREDLFYRLNVLPLEIPPLNQRGNDALELLYYFREKNTHNWALTEEACRFLKDYAWPGNIREVRNLAEYLDSQEERFITIESLPSSITKNPARTTFRNNSCESEKTMRVADVPALLHTQNLDFILFEGRNLSIHKAILQHLKSISANGQKIGRLQLEMTLQSEGFSYSETEIRNCLRKLSEAGYVKSKRGPGGSNILPKGEALLKDLLGILG